MTIVGALALFAFVYVLYPFWTLDQIGEALAARDVEALAPFVDWPKVREGLKADIALGMIKGKDAVKDKMDIAAAALATSISDKMLDSVVSPAGLKEALSRHEPAFAEIKPTIVWSRFSSPTIFRAGINLVPDRAERVAYITMELDGLTWRVTRIAIPALHSP